MNIFLEFSAERVLKTYNLCIGNGPTIIRVQIVWLVGSKTPELSPNIPKEDLIWE